MPDTPLFNKLRFKPGIAVALRHVPAALEGILQPPAGATLVHDPSLADLILDFSATQAEAEERLSALAPSMGDETVVWLAYPKGSKAAGRDLNRDSIWQFARTIGLTAIANVAIDETWSAIRLRRVRPDE